MLNQTLQRLRTLRMTGMADVFAQQLEQPPTQQLSIEERFSLLVDREHTDRDNRRPGCLVATIMCSRWRLAPSTLITKLSYMLNYRQKRSDNDGSICFWPT